MGFPLWFLLMLAPGCAAETAIEATQIGEQDRLPSLTPVSDLPGTVNDTKTPTMNDATAETGLALPTEQLDANGEQTDTESGEGANADVEYVRAVQAAGGSWTFHVTVRHPDRGWEDYADGWDVVTPDGLVVKSEPTDSFTRLLLHPHENEQPFTRSQSGLIIPAGVSRVTVRAHDLVSGFGGRQITVDLTVDSGPGFEVERQ